MPSKLLLPLKYYDNGGRVLPPFSLWLSLVYLSKSVIVLLASLTFVQDRGAILSLFYPNRSHLYFGLIIGLIALVVFFVCGFREKLWKNGKNAVFSFLKPLLITAILMDVLFQIHLAGSQLWAFSWTIGVSLLIDFVVFYWLVTSKHLAYLLLDWKYELKRPNH